MARIVVEIPDKLVADLEPVLTARGLRFEELVRLYARSLVTSSKTNAALTVDSEVPFGKFKGELLGVVIRAEPQYINWVLANYDRIKLAPDALQLLEEVTK